LEGRGQWWKNIGLWVVPAAGGGKPVNLTKKFDFNVNSWTINDLPGSPVMMPPTWSRDGKRIYFQVSRNGNTALYSIGLDGRRRSLELVLGDAGVVGSFGFDKEESKLAYFHADMMTPGDIWLRDLATGQVKRLTKVNDNVLNSVDLGEVEEVWFKGSAGNDLQGWILKPPGFRASRKYPSILEIHGGPSVQYGNFFMHEFYFLATHSYVVYFSNPRGGQGYR